MRSGTLKRLKYLREKLDLTPTELQYYLALEKICRKDEAKISDNS